MMDFYQLDEATTRYSVEVNYRTDLKEVKEGFAKLVLGYVSAALKGRGFHVKKYLGEHPYRIIVSAKNWNDGEWVLVVSFYPKDDAFVLSKGFFNKDRDTVTVQSSEKCQGDTASDIFKTTFNKMSKIKDEKPHHIGRLKGVKNKTGPKKGSMRPAQGFNVADFLSPSNDEKAGS